MEWRDYGTLLAVRRHGETSAIIEVFTEQHGRHIGVVRGGSGRRMSPVLQPGTVLDVTWRARLEEHIGTYSVEPLNSRAARIMSDRMALAGLASATVLLSFFLPEREPHPRLFARSEALFDLLAQAAPAEWAFAYLEWELALLEAMGFGLDLSECAVTGGTDDLRYVSPKTGRAVSEQGAGAWADKLLPLPSCLLGTSTTDLRQIMDGLRTTGHFLMVHLAPSLGDRPLPLARQRLIDALARHSAA